MTCHEVIERLSEFWSNELDEATKKDLASHLEICLSCQREWSTFRSAMDALINITSPEPPPELLTQIKSLVRTKQPRRRVFALRWGWAVAATASAAALVIIFAFSSVIQRRKVTPTVAEIAAPYFREPSLKQPSLPPPSTPSPQRLGSSLPTPKERIEKSKLATIAKQGRREGQGLSTGKELKTVESPVEELPPLGIPSGEQLTMQGLKDIASDIERRAEPLNPKLAELPTTPRRVPFMAELELKEQVKPPALSPSTQPPAGAPMVAGGPATEVQKHKSTEIQPPMAARQYGFGQFGAGQTQVLSIVPITLRWIGVEPVVVGKVRLWTVALSAYNTNVDAVFVQPGEKVEILNAQQRTEAGKFLVWRDKLQPGETDILILLRANEVGARKLLVTIETTDKRTFSWWCIFAATEREEQPKTRKPISIQVSQWRVLDLLSHLAWEGKLSFLLPEPVGNQTVNLPLGTMSLLEVLKSLERQLGGKWQRFGSAFNWAAPVFVPAIPMLKQ
ncbi:MAG: zf-HC2 domain-containing protein [Candidatus Fervidibacter sp.]|uniref:zf-HC2 domain-containing protein n=1 Tax=Candidatus Fervidibacter sp. TaxID=3100871 RepID=UPI004049C4FC